MYYHLLIKIIYEFYLPYWKLLFFNKFNFLLNYKHWQATIKSLILINEPQVPIFNAFLQKIALFLAFNFCCTIV